MRNSWTTTRVWFDYALTHSDHVDAIYWAVLHNVDPNGAEEMPPPPHVKSDMEDYVAQTKFRLAAYDDAWAGYFRETS